MMIEPTGCIPTMKARPLPGLSAAGAVIRATARTAPWYAVPVIPSGWEPVHRPVDGELVGYLAPDCAAGLVLPLTLVGAALGPTHDRAAATALLVSRGLPALNRRWWCRLPTTLSPRVLLAAGEPWAEWGWRPVVLVEVSPARCRLRPEWPGPDELGAQAVLPVPVRDLLRTEPPEAA
jgi:hypothetical protein